MEGSVQKLGGIEDGNKEGGNIQESTCCVAPPTEIQGVREIRGWREKTKRSIRVLNLQHSSSPYDPRFRKSNYRANIIPNRGRILLKANEEMCNRFRYPSGFCGRGKRIYPEEEKGDGKDNEGVQQEGKHSIQAINGGCLLEGFSFIPTSEGRVECCPYGPHELQ